VARIGDMTARDGKICTGDTSVTINNRPAARVGDQQLHPDHDGTVLPPCCASVLIGNRPAARVGDALGDGRGDVITSGDPTVLIGGPPLGAAVGLASGAAVNLIGGRTPGSAPFSAADADRLVHERWGRLLPSTVPSDLFQRTVRFVSQQQIAEEAMAVIERYYHDHDMTMSAADRARYEATARRVKAFATPSGSVFLPEGTSDAGLMFHESLHRYTHPRWIEQVQRRGIDGGVGGVMLNEGMTDMLTRQTLGVPGQQVYNHAVRITGRLADLVGQDTLERAYFAGDTAGLKRAVNAAEGGSRGWEQFISTGRVPG